MDIYIYGNKSFKDEIHKTLEHANIKFKIDVDAKIEDINSLDKLKEKIVQSPSDIYLIDEEKIIKKNLLNQKIKLFTPKDAIEHDFLLENGVADVSVDSINEIPKYIVEKYESQNPVSSDIQDSIIEIVDDAYSEEPRLDIIDLDDELSELLEPEKKNKEFNEDVGLNNTNEDFDSKETHEEMVFEENEEVIENNDEDELELDLSSIEDELKNIDELELDNNENIEDSIEDELDSLLELDEDIDLEKDDDFDFALQNIDEDDVLSQALEIDNIEEDFDDSLLALDSLNEENDKLIDIEEEISEENNQGDNMSEDEFSQLDSLKEDDVLSALEDLDAIVPIEKSSKEVVQAAKSSSNDKVEVSSSNVNDLAQLLGQLLNNKTLEITIKIKD